MLVIPIPFQHIFAFQATIYNKDTCERTSLHCDCVMAGHFVMPGTNSIQFINRKLQKNIFGRYKQERDMDSGNELCGANGVMKVI